MPKLSIVGEVTAAEVSSVTGKKTAPKKKPVDPSFSEPWPLRDFKHGKASEGLLAKETPRGHTGRIVQVFLNADLRGGHEGLSQLAADNGIPTKDLEPGQFVVFINSAKDKVKVYAAGQVIAYCKLERGRKVDLNVIREIPRVFLSTGKLDYDTALKDAVEHALARKGAKINEDERKNA